MLTIRGRLITPFVLGSMTVGLNILIRHSFMDMSLDYGFGTMTATTFIEMSHFTGQGHIYTCLCFYT